MKRFRGIAFGVVCGLLGAGLLLLATSEPRGEPIKLIPPPTPAPILVHIAGAVNEPGVQEMPVGARVKDAIDKCGGLSDQADSNLINLALPLEDGMQIWVPAVQSDERYPPASGGSFSNHEVEPAGQLININTASKAELETLSGIGPVLAGAILQFRQENGPFEKTSDIQLVAGIGPVTYEKIKPRITVGGSSGD
jgi:competence protein ComEA